MIDLGNLSNDSRVLVTRKSVKVMNQFGNFQQYCEDESEVYSDLINLYLQKDNDLV